MRLKVPHLLLFIILSSSFVGCSRAGNVSDVQRPTLEVSHMSSGIGAIEDKGGNHDAQRFTYSIAVANNDSEEVYIKEIDIILPAEFAQRLITKQQIITVNKAIPPKSSIDVESSLDFDATGLSKEDIVKLNPHISSVKVISEKIISLDKWFK